MCIPHWSHCRNDICISGRITIFDLQCMYIKCSSSLPRSYAFSGKLSTGSDTYLNMCGKDTTYVSDHPLPISTPGSVSLLSRYISLCCGGVKMLPLLPCIPLKLTSSLLLYERRPHPCLPSLICRLSLMPPDEPWGTDYFVCISHIHL